MNFIMNYYLITNIKLFFFYKNQKNVKIRIKLMNKCVIKI